MASWDGTARFDPILKRLGKQNVGGKHSALRSSMVDGSRIDKVHVNDLPGPADFARGDANAE